VGVHQDGLVHISRLADRYVSDPNEVAKAGQRMKVRVLEVDQERKRISLSARLEESPSGGQGSGRGSRTNDRKHSGGGGRPKNARGPRAPKKEFTNNPFAALLKKK